MPPSGNMEMFAFSSCAAVTEGVAGRIRTNKRYRQPSVRLSAPGENQNKHPQPTLVFPTVAEPETAESVPPESTAVKPTIKKSAPVGKKATFEEGSKERTAADELEHEQTSPAKSCKAPSDNLNKECRSTIEGIVETLSNLSTLRQKQ